MTIPLATTTITIKRPPASADGTDPYEGSAALDTVATGIRATFSSPGGLVGSAGRATESQEVVDWRLLADPCDLQHYDTVVDDTTGAEFGVIWARARVDPDDGDLDHVVAGVDEIDGAG